MIRAACRRADECASRVDELGSGASADIESAGAESDRAKPKPTPCCTSRPRRAHPGKGPPNCSVTCRSSAHLSRSARSSWLPCSTPPRCQNSFQSTARTKWAGSALSGSRTMTVRRSRDKARQRGGTAACARKCNERFRHRRARHASCSLVSGARRKGEQAMKNEDSKKPTQPVEGEGSYTATRRYNQHLGDAIDSGDVDAAADAARRAMEGPER